MEIENIVKRLTELEKEKKELLKSLKPAKIKTSILELTKPVFEKYPEVLCISWNQYTPYFNDGAPCEFTVDLDGLLFTLSKKTAKEYADNLEIDYNSDYRSVEEYLESTDKSPQKFTLLTYQPTDENHKRLADIESDFTDLLSGLPEDLLKIGFGESASVTITPKKITLDECEHD